MCGIAGVVGISPNKSLLKAMADAMIHRGPDDEGFYLGTEVGFAFRRLSILDLKMGKQPMTNEDQSVWVVFNGEIYNHLILRQELIQRGHQFVTDHSDTEVIVHGWEEWGEDLFNKLNGMFAIGIWDNKQKKLILARDRYGIKPLYYAKAKNILLFASEIKAILASGLIDKKPSYEGILEYFSFQNLWRNQTMFSDINQLEPGTMLIWKEQTLTQKTYWDITFNRHRSGSLSALAEEHRAILDKSVKRQIVADVPVMTYLSGGIDSTAITVSASRANHNVKAYSCIFDLTGVDKERIHDEREYSRLVAKSYNLDRVEFEIAQDALANCLHDYVYSLEDIRMGMGYVNYLIAQRVSEDAKVVLSGTGGDEFHAGYIGRYQALGLTNKHTNPWSIFKNLLKQSHKDKKIKYKQILNAIFSKNQFTEVFTSDFLSQANNFDPQQIMNDFIDSSPSPDWRDKVLYVDAKTYLAGLLTFEDKVSMAHSLEARVPLLDNELIDFILEVPFDYLCQGNIGKILFRESVKPWVPEEIYNKPKMGFGPPDAAWYRTVLKEWISTQLSRENIEKRGVLRFDYVNRILENHFSGQNDNTYLIWSMLNFQAWCEVFNFFE